MSGNNDKLKIEEDQERLKEFLEILLQADLMTIKRLNNESLPDPETKNA